jgi:hypothetical protein
VSLDARLAVWLYARPRLQRAFKGCCALWFGALWAAAAAPHAAAWADPPLPNAQIGAMAWTGLQDTYGVPISFYRVSTVGPLEAAMAAAGQQLQGLSLFNPESWVKALVACGSMGTKNILASGLLDIECAILIVVAGLGIWFLQFTLSASWLQWLATVAEPFVGTLQAMVNHYLVMSFALLACILYGGYIYLAKGRSHGLGIMALVYWLFMDPTQEMLGPHGVMSIGQQLGFVVAEGAINNGALTPGNVGDGIAALTSLLCTALLRDQIQMVNYGTVVDNFPGCASLWSAAIMGGQQDGPAYAMESCDPAALAHAQQLGMGSVGLLFMVLFVMFWITVTLLWAGFHVVLNGFKGFWRLLVLVVALPISVAPGAPRRFGKSQAVMAVRDGLELFSSITGLAVIAIMDGSVLAGGPPGSSGAMSNPLGREFLLLLITVAGAVGLHRMYQQLCDGPGFWGHVHQAEDWLVQRYERQSALDFFLVNFTGNSITGRMRRRQMRRVGRPDDELADHDTMEYHAGTPKKKEELPGREPPQPPTSNHYTANNYYYDGGGSGGQQQANNMPSPFGSGNRPPPHGSSGNQQPPSGWNGNQQPPVNSNENQSNSTQPPPSDPQPVSPSMPARRAAPDLGAAAGEAAEAAPFLI